ncbi:MAG: efflux RND transporter periplasmic adaptor subunit [Bacteroidales bacterium]
MRARWVLVGLGLAGGALFLGAACTRQNSERAVAEDTVYVRIGPVAVRDVVEPIHAAGLLATRQEMKLGFKTGGIVKRIPVREGESVAAGTLLAELNLAEINAQADQARIGYEKATRDLERARNLYRDSVATLEQFQNAQSAFELAQAARQVADFNLRHSRITAPGAGKIQKILSESNELVAPGYPVLLFASTESDWVVRASLSDKDIVKLQVGDSARIRMDPYPGRDFFAEVSGLGTLADPVTGTYEAEFVLLEEETGFRTGFICRVLAYPDLRRTSPVVPVEALINAGDGRAEVYTYRDGEVSKRWVKTGLLLGDGVEIPEGLTAGEWLVIEGGGYIRPGSRVIVNDENSRMP